MIKLPWIKKGDKLLVEGNDWRMNACISPFAGHSGIYATGYKLAADLLIKHIEKTHSDQDSLVYPIIFSYRQFLELMLKEIIKDGNRLLDIYDKIPTHHYIDQLWVECRRIIEELFPQDSSQELVAVEGCIKEFSTMDPLSTAFRYATDKKGDSSLPSITQIDLGNFSRVMNKLSCLLEGVGMGFSEMLSAMPAEE